MATKQEIMQLVIEPLSLLAKPNRDPQNEPAEYARMVNLYVETLEEFSETTIRRGMELFAKDWQTKAWPMPGRLHQYFVSAETERREALPRQPLPQLPLAHVPPEERRQVGAKLTRLRELLATGRLGEMTFEEAREYVYQGEPNTAQEVTKDTYHVIAIRQCGLENVHPDHWTADQRRAVATKQRDYRQKLGIPEPDASRAPVRPAWGAQA